MQDDKWLDNLEVEFLSGVPVKLPVKTKQQILDHFKDYKSPAEVDKKCLQARLVELDLLEQAINREDYGLTEEANSFKLLRLKDLTDRLSRLDEQYEQNN